MSKIIGGPTFEKIEGNIWMLKEPRYAECMEYLPGYYFHDEAHNMHGPFSTLDEVRTCSAKYLEALG